MTASQRQKYYSDMSSNLITKKLFTVDEFQVMGEVGILPKTRRPELIRGEIVEVPIPGSGHAAGVKRLNHLFASRIGSPVIVSVQDPVRLDANSATIPDIALLRPRQLLFWKGFARIATRPDSQATDVKMSRSAWSVARVHFGNDFLAPRPGR